MKKQVDLDKMYTVTFNNGRKIVVYCDKSKEEIDGWLKYYDIISFGKEVIQVNEVEKIDKATLEDMI